MPITLDIFLIAPRRGRYVLFGRADVIEQCEVESGDHIRQFITWLKSHPNRIAAWLGRVLSAGHRYYVQFEDRLDPVERVLKAMGSASSIVLHHSPSLNGTNVESRFQVMLRKQRIKHAFWLSIDVVLGGVAIVLTPILAPIPGPNVFFYYPILRLLSHYGAMRGAVSALGSTPVQFKSLPELSGLEENLQTPGSDRAAARKIADRLKISGLDRFLERMI